MFDLEHVNSDLLQEFRTGLTNHGYTWEILRARTREWLRSFQQGTITEAAYEYLFRSEPPVFMLLKLFMSRQAVTSSTMASLFPEHIVRFLVDVGLVEQLADGYRSRFLLFPFDRYYFVTDMLGNTLSPADRNS